MIAIGALLCLVHLVALFPAASSSRNASFALPTKIDPSRASVGELMSLDGIGRARAEQIVLHRVRNGPFARPDDLLGVDGIGQETLSHMRDFLDIVSSQRSRPGR